MNTLDSKYELKSKKHRQRIIKNWIIVIVVAAIIIWAFAGIPGLEPVSYTHLTLPTKA